MESLRVRPDQARTPDKLAHSNPPSSAIGGHIVSFMLSFGNEDFPKIA
jgi:hypothetical protein